MTTLHTRNRRRAKAYKRSLGFVIGKHRWKYPLARKMSRFFKRSPKVWVNTTGNAKLFMAPSDPTENELRYNVVDSAGVVQKSTMSAQDISEFIQGRNGPIFRGQAG